MSAHDVEVQMGVISDGDADFIVFVHDVHGEILGESVAVDNLPVVGRVVAHIFGVAAIGGVVLYDGAIDIVDEILDELGLEVVGIRAFTGAHLHGNAAFGLHAKGFIDAHKGGGRNLAGEVDLGLCPGGGTHGQEHA